MVAPGNHMRGRDKRSHEAGSTRRAPRLAFVPVLVVRACDNRNGRLWRASGSSDAPRGEQAIEGRDETRAARSRGQAACASLWLQRDAVAAAVCCAAAVPSMKKIVRGRTGKAHERWA
ncbi:hypothetical protein DPSP01_014778 [Paraphaeosphaeria sporulosa]